MQITAGTSSEPSWHRVIMLRITGMVDCCLLFCGKMHTLLACINKHKSKTTGLFLAIEPVCCNIDASYCCPTV